VRALQRRLVHVNGGSAIGRYQIIDDTLDGLVARMGLTGRERFTPVSQGFLQTAPDSASTSSVNAAEEWRRLG
jgi:hypothetical protein